MRFSFILSQRRRAIEVLEARAPPPLDSIATVVNSLQQRVNSITLCITLNSNNATLHSYWMAVLNVRLVWNCPTVFIGRWLNGSMSRFLKSPRRTLILEARLSARNSPNAVLQPDAQGKLNRSTRSLIACKGPTSKRKGGRGTSRGIEGVGMEWCPLHHLFARPPCSVFVFTRMFFHYVAVSPAESVPNFAISGTTKRCFKTHHKSPPLEILRFISESVSKILSEIFRFPQCNGYVNK